MCYVHLLFYVLVLVLNSEAGITYNSNSELSVSAVRDLTCSSQINYVAGQTSYHQWNHVYTQTWGGFDGTITNYTTVQAVSSKYTLTLERFDNLTSIYSNFYKLDINNRNVMSTQLQCLGNQAKNVINLVDDGYYQYKVEYVVAYTEKPFKFNCQQYSNLSKYVYVAWINTEGNRIIVFKNSPLLSDFTLLKIHNGSILCCVYYVETTTEHSVDIRRYVKSKTLFVYQESVSANSIITNTVTVDNSTEKNYCEHETNISVTSGNTNNVFNKTVEIVTTETNKAETSHKDPNTSDITKLPLNKNTDITPKTGKENDDNTNQSENKKPGDSKPNENYSRINTKDIPDFSSWRTDTAIQNAPKMEKEGRDDETDSDMKIPDEKNKLNFDIGTRIGTPNENSRDDSSLTNVQKDIFENTSPVIEDSNLRNGIQKSSTDEKGFRSRLIVIIISICATLLIFIVICILIRRRCQNKTPATRPQQPLPNNEPQQTPFYLNLLFQKECEREMQAADENHVYEEILDH